MLTFVDGRVSIYVCARTTFTNNATLNRSDFRLLSVIFDFALSVCFPLSLLDSSRLSLFLCGILSVMSSYTNATKCAPLSGLVLKVQYSTIKGQPV